MKALLPFGAAPTAGSNHGSGEGVQLSLKSQISGDSVRTPACTTTATNLHTARGHTTSKSSMRGCQFLRLAGQQLGQRVDAPSITMHTTCIAQEVQVYLSSSRFRFIVKERCISVTTASEGWAVYKKAYWPAHETSTATC